jgi:prepilin-type N-terminal cleavage/methylation domain-containing protein/prepilin-type processing-associated H-X9-DG protein
VAAIRGTFGGGVVAEMRRRGFTLSEVLAVIVIIALLVVLMFPVFSGAKASAKATVCLTNLHQIGLATQMYMSDHDGRYPLITNGVSRLDQVIWFGRDQSLDPNLFSSPVEALTPYSKGSKEYFKCPMDVGSQLRRTFYGPKMWVQNLGTSYLFAELFDGQTESYWKDPANQVWVTDGSASWHSRNYDVEEDETYVANVLFYDFHVAARKGGFGMDFINP